MDSFNEPHLIFSDEIKKREIKKRQERTESERFQFVKNLKHRIGEDLVEIIIQWNTSIHGSSMLYRDSEAGDYCHCLSVPSELYTGGFLESSNPGELELYASGTVAIQYRDFSDEGGGRVCSKVVEPEEFRKECFSNLCKLALKNISRS